MYTTVCLFSFIEYQEKEKIANGHAIQPVKNGKGKQVWNTILTRSNLSFVDFPPTSADTTFQPFTFTPKITWYAFYVSNSPMPKFLHKNINKREGKIVGRKKFQLSHLSKKEKISLTQHLFSIFRVDPIFFPGRI